MFIYITAEVVLMYQTMHALSEILVHTLWIRTARWPIPSAHFVL